MRIVLSSLGALALIGMLLGVAIASLWPSPAGEPPPSQTLTFGPESMGVIISPAPGVPTMTEDEAVAIANRTAPGHAAQASSIDARYVLFSNDQYEKEARDGKGLYRFQNIPAWLVTYRGVDVPSHGGNPTVVNHELNIVIDDRSGEVLWEFSYR